jgi:hypothetical protein
MPSKSKKQQKFMGMVRAIQKGKLKPPNKKFKDVAKSMKKKDAKEFASTKHKGLPEKVKKKKKKKKSYMMINKLIKLADMLDRGGFCSEANSLDVLIKSIAHNMEEGVVVEVLDEPSECESNLKDEVYYFDNLSEMYNETKEEDESDDGEVAVPSIGGLMQATEKSEAHTGNLAAAVEGSPTAAGAVVGKGAGGSLAKENKAIDMVDN